MAAHLSPPIFDGHNDALTRDGAPDLATRLDDGHLDLPRMREGGMRGGIFAVFTPSCDEKPGQVRFSRGVTAAPLAPPVGHEVAMAYASAAAARMLALEQAGEVVVARTIGDIDAARDGSSAPVAVLPPTPSSTRSRPATGSSGSSSQPRSCGRISPTTRTLRWP
jgi:membrane dipeptidase